MPSSGLLDAFRRPSKTFFETFWHPRRGGYRVIADALLNRVRGDVVIESPMTGLSPVAGRIEAVHYRRHSEHCRFDGDRVFSTISAIHLARLLGEDVALRFRKIQLVYLNIRKAHVMPYH